MYNRILWRFKNAKNLIVISLTNPFPDKYNTVRVKTDIRNPLRILPMIPERFVFARSHCNERKPMDTTSLIYFAEAAKDLNFTRTAKRLFISQQNLSNHISRLEEHYGVKLFERRPHMALTYAGEVMLSYVARFRMDEDNLKNAFADIKEKEQGVLKIGCSPTRTNIVMPKLAELFLKEYPNVQLQVYQQHSSFLADKLLSGELDIALTTDLEVFHQPNLITSNLFQDSLYLMVKRSLLEQYMGDDIDGLIERSRGGIDIRDFTALPFVDVQSANIFKDVFKYAGCTPNFIVTTSVLTHALPSFYENVAASITTRTIYLHLAPYMPEDLLSFRINPVPGMPLHDIALVRHRRKYLQRHGQRFMEITAEYFEKLNSAHPF